MNMDSPIRANLTVEEVLGISPKTIPVFLALRTDCVGCQMERFCTLKEVARAYKLPLRLLLEKLREPIRFSEKE
jgi:hybrid cluster-associated redox disulfide protein